MTYTDCVCTCILSSLNVFVYDLGSVKCLSKCIPSGVGKRSNRWSAVTIRLALAVYCRSPAAYDALKSFGLLQLPSRSTLQAFTGAFLEDCGEH